MAEISTVKFSTLFSDWKQFLDIPNGIAPLDNQRKLPLENLPSEYLEIIPKAETDYLGLVRPDNVTIQVDESGIISVVNTSSLTPNSIHWNNIVATPSSVLGYGIEDVYTKTEIDSLFPTFDNFYRKNEIDSRIPAIDSYYSKVKIDEFLYTFRSNVYSREEIENLYFTKDQINQFVFSPATLDRIGLVKPDGVTTEIDDQGIISATGSALTTDSIHWDNITSKPSTVYGFGITDCYTKTEIDGLLPDYNISDYYTKYDINEFFLTKETFLAEFPSKAELNQPGLVMPDGITIQVDNNGVISVLNTSTGMSPDSVHWDKIVAKPTTLSGYQLTNVYDKDEVDSIFATKEEAAVQKATASSLGIVKPDNQTLLVSPYGTLTVNGSARALSADFVEGNGGIKIDGFTLSINYGLEYDTVARGDHTHTLNDLDGYIEPNKLAKNSPTSSSFLRGDGYWYEINQNYSTGPGLILDNDVIIADFGLNADQIARGDHTHNINNLDGKLDISKFGDNDPNSTSFLRGDNVWVDVEDIIEDVDAYRMNILSKNIDFTALRFYYFFVDTTDNIVNIILPDTPQDGDWFVIVDVKVMFSTNNAIIKYANNIPIQFNHGDFILNLNNPMQTKFVYHNNNWFVLN